MRKRKIASILAVLFICNITIFAQSDNNPSNRYVNVYKNYLNAPCPCEEDNIKHFVWFARDRQLIHDNAFLTVKRFTGAQIMYPWNLLEPEKGNYDFSIVREDYEFLLAHGKMLFIQMQDATFNANYKGVPAYLLTEEYDGGAVPQLNDEGEIEGWVAKRWNPKVQKRFALMLEALGKEFDGKIEGINFQESAIGVSKEIDSTFTPESNLEGLKTNMLALKKAFPTSTTMQYANFMAGEWLPYDDKGYLRSIYEYGEQIGVGLAGPDLMFKRKGNLNHTVALMHEYNYTVPLGIAIQDGNYIGTTGTKEIKNERDNLVPVLHAFAKEFMKVSYIFWSYQEPYFSEDLIPCFSSQ